MSIIYDALKKLENSSSTAPVETPQRKSSPLLSILLYVLLAGAGAGCAYLLFNYLLPAVMPEKLATVVTAAHRGASAPVAQTASSVTAETTPPAPTPATPPKRAAPAVTPEFNGVFFADNVGCALLNNKICRVGDTVDGARVLEISPEGVVLEIDGKTVTLKSK